MAPISKSVNKHTRRLDNISACAAKVLTVLREISGALPLPSDALQESINTIVSIPASAIASKHRELDENGTAIWNLASKARDVITPAHDLVLGQLDVAEKLLERSAVYEKSFQKVLEQNTTQELPSAICRLSGDYYILRLTLAWRQQRLDLAEIWLAKCSPEKRNLEATVVENLADVLFEIGRDQAAKQLYKSAAQWLEKAHIALLTLPPETGSTDASDLRSCIMHCLVRVHLKDQSEGSILRAWEIIHELDGETENRLALSLLKLELLSMDQTAVHDYHEILIQVVRQIHLVNENVRTILHHVHKLRRRSARLAHTVLAELMSERLLTVDNTAWIEKTLITVVWNCSTSTDLVDSTAELEELLDTVAARSHSALGTAATHAAQILLLRRVETNYNHGDYSQADVWCRLALHNLFIGSGAANETAPVRSGQIGPYGVPADSPSAIRTNRTRTDYPIPAVQIGVEVPGHRSG
ncbi:MAG: hypothetical protein Q9222_000262 [Ikaeria aurantiellina]